MPPGPGPNENQENGTWQGMKEVKTCPVTRNPHAPNPTGQDSRSQGYSHHPHAGRDVQGVDSDAVEEARDGTSWEARQEQESAGKKGQSLPGRIPSDTQHLFPPTAPASLLSASGHKWDQRNCPTPQVRMQAHRGEAACPRPQSKCACSWRLVGSEGVSPSVQSSAGRAGL